MANPTYQKGGLKWRQNLQAPGSPMPVEILPVASAYGTALYAGDIVKMVSTGYIEAAAAGDTAYGVFIGAERSYESSTGFMRKGGSLPASVTYSTNFERQTFVRVVPVFGQVFEISSDEVSSGYDTYAEHLAFIGENCEWIAGTASGDQSGTLLDISTHATTNTLSLHLHGLHNKEMVDYTSAYVPYLVTFNLKQQPTAGSTTGV